MMALDEFVDRLPDAFVMIDRDGVIRRANRAFLDLLQVGAEGAVLGERLARWLSRPGADLSVLLANLAGTTVTLFATGIRATWGRRPRWKSPRLAYPPGSRPISPC